MIFVARILSLGLTIGIAFALTFGTARYGVVGSEVGLLGLLPLLAVRRFAARGGRTHRPLFGFAGTFGLLALNAWVLSAAVAAGVPDLGRLDLALAGAGILSVVWLHAVRLGHVLWGALAVVGLVAGGVSFVATLSQTGWTDPQAAYDIWWHAGSGWGSLVVLGLVCAAIAVVVRWASRRSSAVDDLPAPPTLAPKWTGRPALSRAAGPPLVVQSALDARQAVGREGEQRVRELLLDRLPAGTVVMNNLELPGLGGDVDLLVVGDTGVFLPEVKTWSGAITCGPDGHSWSRITTGGQLEALPDPAAQTQREIRALRAYLQGADPELCRRTQLWIDGFIVFAHPRATLDVDASPVPALVPEAAVVRMRDAVPRRPLSRSDQAGIVSLEKVQPLELARESTSGSDTVTHH